MEIKSIRDFYKEIFGNSPHLSHFLENNGKGDIGNFSVFNIEDLYKVTGSKPKMPYSRRNYYKISLIHGNNIVEYADRILEVKQYAILFATPKIPYYYQPQDSRQKGHFCVFTKDFMPKTKTGFNIDELPVFGYNSDFVFELNKTQYKEISDIYAKIRREMESEYEFKYDLIRNYVLELIHNGQKLKPVKAGHQNINAASRLSALFIELIERQFPVESPSQVLQLRTAKDFADTLRVHINHLNKILKETTGKTTTDIITARVMQEAKILLKQTDWNVSEIAFSLGFEEVAHFSNFFKKQTQMSPLAFRN